MKSFVDGEAHKDSHIEALTVLHSMRGMTGTNKKHHLQDILKSGFPFFANNMLHWMTTKKEKSSSSRKVGT